MSNLIQGERVGRQGILRPGVSAIIFENSRQSVLLTRRTDNGRWCLPGGGMDPGESADEACVREVLEETGLEVRVTRLVGIYTSPNILVEYPDGNKIQPVACSFEAEVIGGELGLSDETTDYGYIAVGEFHTVDLMEHHRQRIDDALKNQTAAIYR
jgi:8-oxo-dGTP pyrophosphatase MutT (NUDIX family)